MTRAKKESLRANKRIDLLVEKLGLDEYESLEDVVFYEFISDGILEKMQKKNRNRIMEVNAKLNALLDYLGLDSEVIQKDTVTIVSKKTTKQEHTKRKYVKSGKYSKKPKK